MLGEIRHTLYNNHGLFKAKPSSHYVHSTLRIPPPTSPCPTLSADAESAHKRTETIFSVQCAVWYNQKLRYRV